jgi:hypothetical protein
MPILEKTTANRKKIKTMFVLVSADLAFAEVKNYKKKILLNVSLHCICRKFINISRGVFAGLLWVVFHPFKMCQGQFFLKKYRYF